MERLHTYKVRGVACDYRAPRERVYEALKRATEPLVRSWERIERAKSIALKFNQDKRPQDVVLYEGRRQQLVSDTVAYAVLRLLRERTDARLFCADVSFYATYLGSGVEESTNIAGLLREFGVEYVDGMKPPFSVVNVPGGGSLFRAYPVIEQVAKADAMVSVAKMKNHNYMGITGCLKNLFGLMPCEPPGIPIGRPRVYYHHLIRMPYMLADLGRIYDPVLNIVDGLVGQAGGEWGDGRGLARTPNILIAGDHPITTDACMARIMGHDPAADWPEEPFLRERSALPVAVESGYGTVDADGIDFESEVLPLDRGSFYCAAVDPPEKIRSWRKTMCEQALYYHENREAFLPFAGEYVLLQDGEVRWHSRDGHIKASRRQLAGRNIDHALFMKFVDPDEQEAERFEIYREELERLSE